MSEYINNFFELVDSLAAYDSGMDSLYFTTRFVDGLKDDIKASILVQRPSDLDTACVLAKLQEEVIEQSKPKEIKKPDSWSAPRVFSRGPQPLPLPPRSDRPGSSAMAQDRRGVDAARYKPTNDKLAALRAYRRAKGLCEKCAERWSREHKCADSIQLHALQEVWDFLQTDDLVNSGDLEEPVEATSPGELFSLSTAAVQGGMTPKTLQLSGDIQGHKVTMLVDSGSSHTFISEQLSQMLLGNSPLVQPVQVAVANGASIQCCSYFPDLQWSSQGCTFSSSARVLPLAHYDVILGKDWLESHSPMQINWKEKWLVLPYAGSFSILQGKSAEVPEGTMVQVCALFLSGTSTV